MAYGICPRCTSWRLKHIEAGFFSDRLLGLANRRRCRCQDCGWRGITRSREKQNLVQVLHQPFVWKGIFFGFLSLVGIYAVTTALINVAANKVPQEQSAAPAAATAGASESTPVTAPANAPSGAVVVESPPAITLPETTLAEIKVIGNRDSKRYHLPGMKYYDRIEAHHRVTFSSEDEAIRAGYHKAPR
jgi:hypothetical protein